MDDRIIICRKDECIVSAVFRGDACFRLAVCRDDDTLRVGNIYIGRVDSIVDNVNAAFVDIGLKTNVYAPLKKLYGAYSQPAHADGRLHKGDTVLVQIDRLPSGIKPASATGEISLVGNAVVLLKERNGVSFSKMIDDPEFRTSMRELFRERKSDDYGIMFRTNAPFFETDKIIAEYELLKKEYDRLTNDIAAQEAKVQEMEDHYYDKFTAMEKALSKLNTESSSFASMLG